VCSDPQLAKEEVNMKKFGFLLIGLLLVASFAVAQEVTIEADATFTIGTDLDAKTFGFKNESSSSLAVEWAFDDTATEGQGFIKLTDLSLLIDSDEDDLVVIDAPEVEAGWMTGPLTVTVWAKPDLTGGNAEGFIFQANEDEVDDDEARDEAVIEIETNNIAVAAEDPFTSGELTVINAEDYADEIADPDYDGYLDDAVGYDVDFDGTDDFYYYVADTTEDAELDEFYGVTIDVDLGVAMVTVIAATDGDWEENLDNSFAFGGLVSVPTDMVTLDAGVWLGVVGSEDPVTAAEHPAGFAFTLGANGTVGPLTFDAGYDSVVPDSGNWSIDASLALGVEVAGIAIDTLSYLKFIGVDTDLDQEVVLDLSGLVEGVTLKETVQLPELLSAAFDQWYTLTTIGFGPATLEVGVDQEAVVDLNVSLELDGLVENTVFTIEWDVEDAWYSSLGTLTASGKISY
jgi:hypothetical protein